MEGTVVAVQLPGILLLEKGSAEIKLAFFFFFFWKMEPKDKEKNGFAFNDFE